MIYKVAVILLTVACLKDAQSVFLVNCPTNYIWNVQQFMCVQQNYCGSAMFGQSYQYCGLNYAPFSYQYYNLPIYYHTAFNHYSACQTVQCPCYHSACQHIQTCYAQVPCYYWYIPNQNRSEPIRSTTTTTTTTAIPPITTTTTTTTAIPPITTTTNRPTISTTKRKPTKESQEIKETNGFDFKFTNVINSHNHVYSPVYVNNTNIVTKDMRISQAQQETTETGTNGTDLNTRNTTTSETEKCCRISSPKMCKQRYDESWVCYHRKYRRCGQFCYRENMYLRPQRIQYRPPTLVMPPPRWNIEHYYTSYDHYSPIDCSGCVYGGYHCSSACYTYSCHSKQCGYIDQEYFCSNYGGYGCNEYDGYFN